MSEKTSLCDDNVIAAVTHDEDDNDNDFLVVILLANNVHPIMEHQKQMIFIIQCHIRHIKDDTSI